MRLRSIQSCVSKYKKMNTVTPKTIKWFLVTAKFEDGSETSASFLKHEEADEWMSALWADSMEADAKELAEAPDEAEIEHEEKEQEL